MARIGKPDPHTDLFLFLNKAINQEQLESMKNTVKSKEYGGFLAGELEKLSKTLPLLEKMEHKGVFRVTSHPTKKVNYIKLKEIIRKCEIGSAEEEITSAESKLADLGYVVERECHADAAFSSPVAMETEPPLNVNNSRSDRSDAFPSGIVVADSGGGSSSDEFVYAKGKGYLLYINNFENSGEPRRKGSEKDKDKIEELFEDDLKFKCVYEKDLNKPQLLKLLQKTKDKLAKGKYSSFFLIIGTHGEQFVVKNKDKEATVEGIVTVDSKYITEDELTKPFLGDELKELRDKPKVFIIQACRAPRPDRSDDMESTSEEESPSDSTQPTITKPVNADVLISYATSKGTKAWRNDEGSWYFSKLCKGIKEHSKKHHLSDILVRVNHAIALMGSSEDGSKQMPCQMTTLTKDFWLQ